jgi:hypothetical protein
MHFRLPPRWLRDGWKEQTVKLYDKLVADDRAAEAALMEQGRREALEEMAAEECPDRLHRALEAAWQTLSPHAYAVRGNK